MEKNGGCGLTLNIGFTMSALAEVIPVLCQHNIVLLFEHAVEAGEV